MVQLCRVEKSRDASRDVTVAHCTTRATFIFLWI